MHTWLDLDSALFFSFLFHSFPGTRKSSWCDTFRKPPYVSRESFSNLRMTRLFRGDRAKRVKDTTQSFLPPSRRGRTKEIDVFRSFPSTHFLLTSAVRPERYDRGRVYARTSNQSGTGYRRLYTSRHQPRGEPARRYVPKSGRRFASPPSWISPIRGLLPRPRLPDNNGAFHMPPATKVFETGPSVSSTYLTRGFGSPFFVIALFARGGMNWIW